MPHQNGRKLIAIVEDDRAVLASLQFSLEAEGYQVLAFDAGSRALKSSDIDRADCLVIDYFLPGMDGVELMHALRDRSVACPAIIVASEPTLRCRKAATAAGVPLLEKPLAGEVLARQILTSLSLSPCA